MGGYCKNVPLKKLMTQPLNTFAKLLSKRGAFVIHEKCDYLVAAVQAAKQFLNVANNPELDVMNQVDIQRLKGN